MPNVFYFHHNKYLRIRMIQLFWNIFEMECFEPVEYIESVKIVSKQVSYTMVAKYIPSSIQFWNGQRIEQEIDLNTSFISSILKTFRGCQTWGRDKMDAISQTTFSNAFSWKKMLEFRLKFRWNLFLSRGSINNIPALVQIMAWRRPGAKLLSEPRMVILLTHICVIRPQWINASREAQYHELNVWLVCEWNVKF